MAADAGNPGGGFWRGFFAGLAVAAVGLVALALVYPPAPATPPEIDPDAVSSPAAPSAPEIEAAASGPDAGLLGPAPAGPLLSDRPAAAAGSSLVPVPANDAAASGPSLAPQD